MISLAVKNIISINKNLLSAMQNNSNFTSMTFVLQSIGSKLKMYCSKYEHKFSIVQVNVSSYSALFLQMHEKYL